MIMEALTDYPLLLTGIVFIFLFLLLGSGIWIAIGIGLVGLFIFDFFISGNTLKIQGMLQFNILNSFTLCTVPLFIFMGEIMMRSGIADKLYRGVTPLVAFFPGGLLHTNIVSSAIFSAVSGSSLATAATIGTTAIPELLDKRNYNVRMALGSLAGGGTLGILIPPSISLIIYGAWTNQSIGQLFIAGVFPGIILTILFMGYIALRSLIQPDINPPCEKVSFKRMFRGIPDVLPSTIIILVVLGSIYLGIATPTESAALGVTFAMVIALFFKRLSWGVIKESAFGASMTTAMITLIIVCAQMMSMGLSMLRIPSTLADVVASLQVGRWWIMLAIACFYIGLGCVLEALSMLLLTLPIIYPIILSLNFDPIWFGIVITVFIEMAQITPPIGINLFIIQGVSGGRKIEDVAIGILPFFLCQVLILIILFIFPNVALWLPLQMLQ
jgi:tripartite ATP-independent transporter DctM subunit